MINMWPGHGLQQMAPVMPSLLPVGNATGPEHWYFSVAECHRVAKVWFVDVLNTQRLRFTNMYRCAMDGRVTGSNSDGISNLMSRNRPHGDHQFAFQPASFTAGAIGSVHRHIAIFADMADINACLHQWCFECEAAANQK
nr:Uncharacterised protein [Klebsiella pneumoniae]